jgi:hypothetical protein
VPYHVSFEGEEGFTVLLIKARQIHSAPLVLIEIQTLQESIQICSGAGQLWGSLRSRITKETPEDDNKI